MYKAKITNLDFAPEYWVGKYRVGDIIKIANSRFKYWKKFVKVIEHYKMITVSKKRCKHCGNWVIKREKRILD